MSYWSTIATPVLLISLLTSVGVGQDFCRHALADRPFPRLRNAVDPVEGGNLYSIVSTISIARMLRVDSLVRGLMKASVPDSGPQGDVFGPEPEWFPDSSEISPAIRLAQPKDSARRWDAAFQLAHLFNGGALGGTEGMAYAAASLYKYWHLPPAPAMAFLADPAFSVSARLKAVGALEPYWSTREFQRAAAAALCTLAVKAAGLNAMQINADSSGRVPLDYQEYEFFSKLMWALGSVEEAKGPSLKAVIALLPPGNALTRWVAAWLHL